MNRELWERAERNLEEIMKSPFKKETVEQYRRFVDSVNREIEEMDSHCSSPPEQLRKQMTL